MSKKIPVSQLSLGMYVTELDRPWLESPFLFQGFSIESPDQLSALQESVTVQLHNRARQRWEDHPALVVYTEPLPSGQRAVGCAFLKPLADQAVQEVL